MKKIKISDDLISLRLDKALSILLSDISRNKIQGYLDDGLILVNSKKEKASYKLNKDDEIEIDDFPKESSSLEAENIPLDIVYEDEYLLVINKPIGLVTHPGAGNKEHTLANALKFYSDNLSSLNGDFRPGIVHRLDKDTAGLLVVAKNDYVHAKLQEQLKDHTLGRHYLALVNGVIKENEGEIIAPIGRDKNNRTKMAVDIHSGKEAITYFKVKERYKNHTLVECILKTGRTHQIRVHFTYINHPIEGDLTYGKGNKTIYKNGQLLFAYYISFIHPISNKKMEFEVSLPDYFLNVLKLLRGN